MNRDLIVNICGTIQLVCVGVLGYAALKRNEECYEAKMALISEKKKRLLTELNNVYLKIENDDLKRELKELKVAKEEEGES